jgi:large subunit ribosomal protein L9
MLGLDRFRFQAAALGRRCYRKMATRKTVEVLLARDRPGLGLRGDTVNVAPGFARHRLVPYGDAVRTVIAEQVGALRAEIEAEATAERSALSEVVVSLEAASALPFFREAVDGSSRLAKAVTAADIADALAMDRGLEVVAAKIRPQEVDTAGEHTVVVLLGRAGVPATVRINVASRKAVPQ